MKNKRQPSSQLLIWNHSPLPLLQGITGLITARRTVTENGRTIPITSQQNNLLTVMVRLQVKFNLPLKRTSFEHHLTGPKTC